MNTQSSVISDDKKEPFRNPRKIFWDLFTKDFYGTKFIDQKDIVGSLRIHSDLTVYEILNFVKESTGITLAICPSYEEENIFVYKMLKYNLNIQTVIDLTGKYSDYDDYFDVSLVYDEKLYSVLIKYLYPTETRKSEYNWMKFKNINDVINLFLDNIKFDRSVTIMVDSKDPYHDRLISLAYDQRFTIIDISSW